MIDRTDWQLNPVIFRRINQLFSPSDMDHFVSRLTTQLQVYFSWRPDPYASATDAFLQDWSLGKGYGNPPCRKGLTCYLQTHGCFVLCIWGIQSFWKNTRLLTSTEKLQQWNKPWPKKLEIMPVAELTSRKSDILRRNKKSNMNGSYDPRPPEYRKLLVIRLLRNYIVTYYLLINHQLS